MIKDGIEKYMKKRFSIIRPDLDPKILVLGGGVRFEDDEIMFDYQTIISEEASCESDRTLTISEEEIPKTPIPYEK